MNSLYKFLFLFIALGLSSCGDEFLELAPSNSLPVDQAVVTVADMETALMGAYSQMQNSDWYGRYFVLVPDVMSDDVKQNAQANRAKDWAEYIGNVNDGHSIPEEIWTEVYEGINRANLVINANVDVPSLVQEDANQFLGEARAIRALAHFDLVRIYAQHYSFSSGGSHAGVPIVTSFDQDAEPTRNTVNEVYDAVIADLNAAIGLMTQDRGRGFFSSDAAKALLARVYLYKEDWTNAESTASQVIESGSFSLTAGDSYIDQWNLTGFSPDAILDVIQTEQDNMGANALGGMYNVTGYGDYLPSLDLVNLIDENDVRSQLFAFDETLGGGDLGDLRVAKYPSNVGENNTPVLRLSETYLIRAEARARLGNEAGAIEDLMTIRRRAWVDAPDVTASGQALLDEIELEKRIELMYEGHRLWELTRRQKGVIRNDCTAPGDACQINYPNDRFILPIPIQEIFANPNMAQNPGFSS